MTKRGKQQLPFQPVEMLSTELSSLPSVIFTDVDDTLTHDNRLPAETFTALYRLKEANYVVVPVTGASAGWCDCLIKTWPISSIIGENGAFTMEKNRQGIVSTRFVKSQTSVNHDLKNLLKLGHELSTVFKDIRFTQDQPFRLTDVAFDIGQTVQIDDDVAELATQWLLDQDVQARRSSIHINTWIGKHSKASTAASWLQEQNLQASDCVFIGDSPNDEAMFQHFPVSVGVSNIERFLSRMKFTPAYVTPRPGGYGFVNMVDALLNPD